MKKVILCLVIIALIAVIGVGGWFLWDSLQKEKSKTGELQNKVDAMETRINNADEKDNKDNVDNNDNKDNSTEIKDENKKNGRYATYDSLHGTYESQLINLNEGTDLEPYNINYTLVFSKEGTFAAYYKNGDTECHYVGYYTINESQVVLNCVVFAGNDPSANLCNEVIKFNINNDGTLSDNENNKFTKTSSTPREETNIAKIIDSYMAGCGTTGKDGQGPWFSGLSK